jgi:hypothetical protein
MPSKKKRLLYINAKPSLHGDKCRLKEGRISRRRGPMQSFFQSFMPP